MPRGLARPATLPPLPEAGCRQLLLGHLCLCGRGPAGERTPGGPHHEGPHAGPGPRSRRDVWTRGWTDTQLAAGRGCRESAEAGAGGQRVAQRVLEILASCFPNKGPSVPPPQRMCLFREQCCFLFSRHSERGPHPRGPAGEALRETGPCRATWDDSPRASRGQEFGGARSMGGGGRPEQPWGLLESGSWGRGGCAESRPSGPDPAAPRAEPGLVYTGWVSREGQQGPGLPPGGSTSTQAGEAAPGSWVLSQVDAVLPAPQIKSSGSERLSPSGTQGSRPRVPAPRGRETGPDPAGKEGPRGSRPLGHVALRSDQ